MRNLPADLALEPMPADFTCLISQADGLLMKASATIDGLRYEIGLQGTGTADEVRYLKESIWQLHELFRVGRTDLMRYASVDRHSNRPRGA